MARQRLLFWQLMGCLVDMQAWFGRHPPKHARLATADLDSTSFSDDLKRAEDSANEDSGELVFHHMLRAVHGHKSVLYGSTRAMAYEYIDVTVDWARLCAESADSAHADREPQPARQHRKQQPLRAAFRVLLPGQERWDKGEHIV